MLCGTVGKWWNPWQEALIKEARPLGKPGDKIISLRDKRKKNLFKVDFIRNFVTVTES